MSTDLILRAPEARRRSLEHALRRGVRAMARQRAQGCDALADASQWTVKAAARALFGAAR